MAAWLAAHGPIDLNILGLGRNGHLGFNEPAAALQAGPHIARLSRASLRHSMIGNTHGRVRYGLTLGMGDLLRSREIVLLVNGPHKAAQLHRLLTGHVTPRFPASFLRLHPALTIFCDRAAAALLPLSLVR
jgi:galactosamine-6-phosphate isomerase